MAMTLSWGGPTEEECPGGCTESTVNTTTESNALGNAPTQNVAAAAVVARTEQRLERDATRTPIATETSSTSIVATTVAPAAPATPAAGPTCSLSFAIDLGSMTDAAVGALGDLNRATSNIDLVMDGGATVEIRFGGEWPTDAAPLGWTSPDGRQILINPDHPYANEPAVIHEIVSHELGHVLIGPQHVADGSLLDPRLNGQVMLNDSDRAALSAVTCADLGYG